MRSVDESAMRRAKRDITLRMKQRASSMINPTVAENRVRAACAGCGRSLDGGSLRGNSTRDAPHDSASRSRTTRALSSTAQKEASLPLFHLIPHFTTNQRTADYHISPIALLAVNQPQPSNPNPSTPTPTHFEMSNMMSAPHLAVFALPVMGALSRRATYALTSTISPLGSPTLSDDSFVVGCEPAAPSTAVSVLRLGSAAIHACASVFDLKARLTAQAAMLTEAQDEMAEDEGDEDDWYAEERAARTKAALTKQLNRKLMDLEPIHII